MKSVIQTSDAGTKVVSGRSVVGFPGRLWRILGSMFLLSGLTLAACNESPLDSGFPQVEVIMDSLEYGRAPVTGEARVTFLIANRGPGIAYFEGCPDPIGFVIEVFSSVDNAWREHDEKGRQNSCRAGEVPTQEQLESNQAYGYTLIWDEPGTYRITVFYGDEVGATTGHFEVGPEYAVQ